MNNKENYNDLYLFMLVVKEGGFTGAARRLGIAQSGISRSIRELEKRINLQLLVRTTRKISLTQAGEKLFNSVESGFELLDAGISYLEHYRSKPSGTVRINASQHAIDKILLPKLSGFSDEYPDIRVELISESRFVDIISERFDAGVRLGNEVEESMIAIRISADIDMAIVGTPEHFRRFGFPKIPSDLAAHPCNAYQFSDGRIYAWELKVEENTELHYPQGQWVFTDSYMEAKAARLGLGLSYIPKELVSEELESGRLIRVLQQYSKKLDGAHLYFPHRNVSPALRLVIDRLKI